MIRSKAIFVALVVCLALSAVPAANATTVKFIGAGSSAMWQSFAVATFNNVAGAGAHHYTIKGNCASGPCAQMNDLLRSTSIPLEAGQVWIVWDSTQTNVWAYIQLDSVVGNRAFFAVPRARLQLDSSTETTAGSNLISSALFTGAVADDTSLPVAIYNALNLANVTAGMTDIRSEDAAFAQRRAVTPLNNATLAGLGYGTSATQQIGTQIASSFSSTLVTPVAFNTTGSDPFTGRAVPKFTTISVGATPVLVLANRTNVNGLGQGINNITVAQAKTLWTGANCNTSALGAAKSAPITVLEREPLSGTYNTFEFTNIRLTSDVPSFSASQETGVNPANVNNNPLNLTCTAGAGSRRRAIGTGEMVKTAILPTSDSIGYAFFSYGNVSAIANSANYGYLTLNGVDPISSTYTTGQLPTCTAPCSVAAGTSFPNLRNGTYRSWSVLRLVTDTTGSNFSNASAIVAAAQANINTTVPDFVPAKSTQVGEPGLTKYRSHFLQNGAAGNNGLSGQIEAGGDMGGCIEAVGPAPGVLNQHMKTDLTCAVGTIR